MGSIPNISGENGSQKVSQKGHKSVTDGTKSVTDVTKKCHKNSYLLFERLRRPRKKCLQFLW